MVAVLSKNSPDIYKNIYVDIIDDKSLNALATISHDDEIVGVNAGAGISLQYVFLTLLAHREVF